MKSLKGSCVILLLGSQLAASGWDPNNPFWQLGAGAGYVRNEDINTFSDRGPSLRRSNVDLMVLPEVRLGIGFHKIGFAGDSTTDFDMVYGVQSVPWREHVVDYRDGQGILVQRMYVRYLEVGTFCTPTLYILPAEYLKETWRGGVFLTFGLGGLFGEVTNDNYSSNSSGSYHQSSVMAHAEYGIKLSRRFSSRSSVDIEFCYKNLLSGGLIVSGETGDYAKVGAVPTGQNPDGTWARVDYSGFVLRTGITF